MEVVAQRLRGDSATLAVTWKHISQSGLLFCNICDKIFESSVLIGEVTAWNTNVLVELGLGIAIGRKCYLVAERETRHLPPPLLQDLTRLSYATDEDILRHLQFDNDLPSESPYRVPFLSPRAFSDRYTHEEADTALLLVPSNERHRRHILPQVRGELQAQGCTVSAPEIGRDLVSLYEQIEASEWVIADFLPDAAPMDAADHAANAEVGFLVGTAIGLKKKVIVVRERGTANLAQIPDLYRLTLEYDQIAAILEHIRGKFRGTAGQSGA